ncbi:MAG: hypothetical protein RLZZ136_1449 [Pseudomonadota bacterium]|jgi:guanylate cyclase soluble subunit beta
MYGMIHRGIRQMVIDARGEEAWQALEREQGIGPHDMITALVHDDELTVRLLTAAAERLGLSFDDCLKAFGRYWIRFAEAGPFSAIMDFTGRDIASFITNLDRMHQAVVAALPEARVPSFTLVRNEPGNLLVQYRSDRTGLEAFVVGLLYGLMARFGIDGKVTQVPSSNNTAEFVMLFDPG